MNAGALDIVGKYQWPGMISAYWEQAVSLITDVK